jgi:hypothetical protein
MPDSNYDTHGNRCEISGHEPETCWNCEVPLEPGAEVVASGGIFCSEDCHEAFTTTTLEPDLTNRKDTDQWPNQSNN